MSERPVSTENRWFKCAAVVVVTAFLSAVPCARGDTLTWVGASSADWFDVTNWNPVAAVGGPLPTDLLTLDMGTPDAGIATVTTDLGGSITLNSLDFASSAAFESLIIGAAGSGTVTVNGADFFATTVSVNGAASKFDVKETFNLFVVNLMASNSASFLVDLAVTDVAALIVENASFNSSASMTVKSGNMAMTTLALQGINTAYQGTGGGVETAALTLSDGASVNISGSHSLSVKGTTTIGPGANPVTISSVDPAGFRTGTLVLNGGQLNSPNGLVVNTLSGFGTVNGDIAGDKFAKMTATGSLTLGDAGSFLGFNHDGTLDAGASTVTLHAAGFANLGVLTILNGGTIQAANGVAIGIGDNLSGNGQIQGKVAAGFGSVIVVSGGNLTLGDAGSPVGFASDGELHAGNNTIVIHDQNEAVLGTLTTIGDAATPASPGTLTAANGLLLEQGKNLIGYGVVNGGFINQGYVEGVGPNVNDGIEFTGDVSGIGNYAGNILFSAGFSPGNSPGAVSFENNLVFTQSANYVAEIVGSGGAPGADYDQVNVTANASLDGALDIVLLNGFVPDYMDEFNILAAGTRAGRFDQMDGLFINPNMTLAPVYDRHGNTGLTLVAAIPGDANLDGIVNGQDLLSWQANLFSGDQWVQGDFNLDGLVSGQDLLVWQSHLFASISSITPLSSALPHSVPEPVTLSMMMGLGLLSLVTRKPR